MEQLPRSRRLFVGTYTDGGASEGIYVLAFNQFERSLRVEHAGTHAPNPSFLVRSGSALYVAHELSDRSCLAVYSVADDGSLACRGTCSSPADAGTCFVAAHPDGRCLYGANYESGPVGLCLLTADGNPCGGLPSVRHVGSGPNRARQSAPHVHSASFVPGTALLAVADLGCDTVTLYRAEATGALEMPPVETVRVPAGSGPRMLAFHPRLPLAGLVNELADDVLLLRFDRAGRHWEQIGCLELPTAHGKRGAPNGSSDAVGATQDDTTAASERTVLAAHPAFSPDGRHLYVSVRGSDRIALFNFDANGNASLQADYSSGGRGPRHFSLSPAGDHLAVANQDSGEVALFALDAVSGAPWEETRIAVPQPSCIIWDG